MEDEGDFGSDSDDETHSGVLLDESGVSFEDGAEEKSVDPKLKAGRERAVAKAKELAAHAAHLAHLATEDKPTMVVDDR